MGKAWPGSFRRWRVIRIFFSPAIIRSRVVLFGLSGKIDVGGKSFDGVMPPLDVLNDEEIAAVVRYVRTAWGNAALRPKDMQPADAAMVAGLRKNQALANQVYSYRQSLRATAGAAQNKRR